MHNKTKRPTLSLKNKKISTGVTTSNENLNSIRNLKITISELSEKFPECFAIEKNKIKPLKIGILDDLVIEYQEKSKTHLRRMLRYYTARKQYLNTIINETVRFDLNGNACGAITDEQKNIAIGKLKKSK